MTSRAAFKIRNVTTDGAWSASTDRGFVAEGGETIALQLEASPALDVQSTAFLMLRKSKGAPDLVIPQPTTPTEIVEVELPPDPDTWWIQCQVNGGEPLSTAQGLDYEAVWFDRIVAVRGAFDTRKILVTERTEFDPTYGWAGAQNDMVDAFSGAGIEPPPGVAPLSLDPMTGYNIGEASDDNRGTMSSADFGKLKTLQPGYLGTSVSGASFVPSPNRLYVVTTSGAVACNLPAVSTFLDAVSEPGELILKGFTMIIVGTAEVTINRNGTDEIYGGVDGMVVSRLVDEPGIFVTVQALGEGTWGVSSGAHEP